MFAPLISSSLQFKFAWRKPCRIRRPNYIFQNKSISRVISASGFKILLILLFTGSSVWAQQIADNYDNYFNNNFNNNRYLSSAGVSSDGIRNFKNQITTSRPAPLPHQKIPLFENSQVIHNPQQSDGLQQQNKLPTAKTIHVPIRSITPKSKLTQNVNFSQYRILRRNQSLSLNERYSPLDLIVNPELNARSYSKNLNPHSNYSQIHKHNAGQNSKLNTNNDSYENSGQKQNLNNNQNLNQNQDLNDNQRINQNFNPTQNGNEKIQNQNFAQNDDLYQNQNLENNHNFGPNQNPNWDRKFYDDEIFSPEQRKSILNPISSFFQKLLQRIKYPNRNFNSGSVGNDNFFRTQYNTNDYTNTNQYLVPPPSQQYGVFNENGGILNHNSGYEPDKPVYGVPPTEEVFPTNKPQKEGSGNSTSTTPETRPQIYTNEHGFDKPNGGVSTPSGPFKPSFESSGGIPFQDSDNVGKAKPTEEYGSSTTPKPDTEGYNDPRPTPGIEVIEQSDAEGIFIDTPEAPPPDVLPERGFVTSSTSTTSTSKTEGPTDLTDAWDIRNSVPGRPLIDYPVLFDIPQTNFTCENKISGFYADPETRCQVFHRCTDCSDQPNILRESFLCPNGTQFNQQVLNCDWWTNVDCPTSDMYFTINQELGAKNKDGNYFQLSAKRRPILPKKEVPHVIPPSKRRPLPPELRSHHHHHHHDHHGDSERDYFDSHIPGNQPLEPITGSEEQRQKQQPQLDVTNFQSTPALTPLPTSKTTTVTRRPKPPAPTPTAASTKVPIVVSAVYSDYFNDETPFRNAIKPVSSTSAPKRGNFRRVRVRKLQLRQGPRQRQIPHTTVHPTNNTHLKQIQDNNFKSRADRNYDFDTSDENDEVDIDNFNYPPRISSKIARVGYTSSSASASANNSNRNDKSNRGKKIVSYIVNGRQTTSTKH